jgi:hypothetical protein
LRLIFFIQLRTTVYAQIFKGNEAMHVTWKTQHLRTVNNIEPLKTRHCGQSIICRKAFYTILSNMGTDSYSEYMLHKIDV